jgi:hypothetical protein
MVGPPRGSMTEHAASRAFHSNVLSFPLVLCLSLLAGCGADRFEPQLPPETDSIGNESAARPVTVLVMVPAYGVVEQIRRGNMGHAAIDVDGRLYDMGSLNGYAFPFRASTAVRFWNFPTADAALRAIVNQPDCDGHLDRILRFDVQVTAAQADRLHAWWGQLEARVRDQPGNRLYVWNDWQCATSVSRSLRDAGVLPYAVRTPAELATHLSAKLRHTAGDRRGTPAARTLVQPGHPPPSESGPLTLLVRFPRLFTVGERSDLTVPAPPDGVPEPLLWSDSPAYHKEIAQFRVPPAEAVQRATDAGLGAGAQPLPNFVLGRWYHIPTDHVIGQAALGGTYVHGDTGAILRSPDPRVIRFDSFDGDRLVTPPGI